VEWYSGTSPKSLIPNETRNQRGFAVVSVSGYHNDVTTSKKGTNQRGKEKKSNLHQKWHRHVGYHLCGKLLILNFWIFNLHHQNNLHNLKEKVFALAFFHVRRFQHQIGFQHQLRFQSLSWFQQFMIHRVLCITCQNS